MEPCRLEYIPERLKTNNRLPIQQFEIGEFVFRRCPISEVENPFLSPSIREISTNRSGGVDQNLSRKEDTFYCIIESLEKQQYTDVDIAVLKIISLDANNKYLKKFTETKNLILYTGILELIHDPKACMYPHSVFRIWVDDVVIEKDNYEVLRRLKQLRTQIREELASMIIFSEIDQESVCTQV